MTVVDVQHATMRETFGYHPSGVVAICAQIAGEPVGLAASTFVPVSLDPPLGGLCVRNDSTTWPRLAEAPRLGLSVLGVGQAWVARQLASRDGDRFAGFAVEISPEGALFVHGSCAWLDCEVDSVLPAGDHGFVLLRVRGRAIRPETGALVFHRGAFHRVGWRT